MNNSVPPGFQKKENQTARNVQQHCLEPQLHECPALGYHTPRRHRSPLGLGPPEDTPGRQVPCQVLVFFLSSFLLTVLDFSNVISWSHLFTFDPTPVLSLPAFRLSKLWPSRQLWRPLDLVQKLSSHTPKKSIAFLA